MLVEKPPATLSSLLDTGVLSPPFAPVPEMVLAGTTRNLPKNRNDGLPVEAVEFSRKDREIIVHSHWQKKAKRGKGLLSGVVYDAENRPVVKLVPLKISFGSEMSTTVSAAFSPANLPAAPYRIDLVFEGEICWRSFVRIVD
jgi:recombinational DNA repair protein (RecF pathway)